IFVFQFHDDFRFGLVKLNKVSSGSLSHIFRDFGDFGGFLPVREFGGDELTQAGETYFRETLLMGGFQSLDERHKSGVKFFGIGDWFRRSINII
ncbi:unnamed protein product, partial [marine sediment metagenome]